MAAGEAAAARERLGRVAMQTSGRKMQEGYGAPDVKRRGIYTYEAPWNIYSMNWSVRADIKFRLAVGSFIEDFRNKVEIVQLDSSSGKFFSDARLSFNHPYPATKLMFIPDKESSSPDLLATTGDHLRLWQVHSDHVSLTSELNNRQNSDYCSPLTSFDWNESDLRRLGTSSIDTTCTIWDIEAGVVDTQLIAHDKAVHDIAWGGVGVFASVSADGSVRVFDLRDKQHSTIIYESPGPGEPTPLLRLGWNKQDPRFMATITMDSAKVVILDIRYPTVPVSELQRHQAWVNAIAWAPHSACHICSAGDDAQALIWDMSAKPVDGGLDPILAYTAGGEVSQLQWSASHSDWVAIAFANKLQVLRV